MSDGSALRQAVSGFPAAAWLCALVAVLGASAWSLITPLFQTPDETAHVAYAQYVAEHGRPPTGLHGVPAASQEERRLLKALAFKQVEFRPDNRPLTTAADRRRIERVADADSERAGEGGYNYATNNPPLYYALAAVAYGISPSQNLTDRIHLMRLLSALLAGITVLFVFGFLRELLPSSPGAWTIGALVVALMPSFTNIAGGVNNDNLLFTAAAGCFFLLAAAFRRGLDVPLGLALGGLVAIGFLTKINLAGLVPGIALGLALIVWRTPPERRRAAVRGVVAAALAAALPALVFMALNSGPWDRGLLRGTPETAGAAPGSPGVPDASAGREVGDAVSYVWEFYLPRLPFMDEQLSGYPLADVWFEGWIGRFGLGEFGFPGWAYLLGLAAVLGILALAGRELWRRREALRARWGELLAYAVAALGLLAVIHWAGYTSRLDNAGGFEQVRYLFPLLAPYAALIALAVRGAGRRWGGAAGVLIVSLAAAQSLAAILLALDRYYA